jgi:hypothetical protein
MYPIELGGNQPVHKLRNCNKCDVIKPPEGGIDMGHKWICQSCWIARLTGKHLRENLTQK